MEKKKKSKDGRYYINQVGKIAKQHIDKLLIGFAGGGVRTGWGRKVVDMA